jgi:hypothetical protein
MGYNEFAMPQINIGLYMGKAIIKGIIQGPFMPIIVMGVSVSHGNILGEGFKADDNQANGKG